MILQYRERCSIMLIHRERHLNQIFIRQTEKIQTFLTKSIHFFVLYFTFLSKLMFFLGKFQAGQHIISRRKTRGQSSPALHRGQPLKAIL